MADEQNLPATPVSLETVAADTPPVNLDTSSAKPPVSDDVAKRRAFKTYQGLGATLNRPEHDIYSEIAGGREQTLREEAASNINFKNATKRQDQLQQLVQLQGGNISQEDMSRLLDPTREENKPVDPKTVIEQGYGRSVVSNLDEAGSSTNNPTWKEAKATVPSFVQDAQDKGSILASKRELAQTLLEDTQNEIQHQNWWEWGADTAKGMVPGYNEAELRNSVTGSSFLEGGGLGSNLDLQTRRLLAQPFDTYKEQLPAIVDQLKQHSPQLAAQFLQAVLGQSNTSIMAGNIGTAMDISMIPGAQTLGKTALKGIGLINIARQATKDVIEASAAPEATKAALSNAAGDATSSAVHQTADNLMKDVKGMSDPEKRAVDALTSNLQSDIQQMRQNAGRFGQEGVNRIEERMWSVAGDVLNRIIKSMKVDVVPELKESEEVFRAVKSDIEQDYRGMPNKLMDVKGPFWDRISNTWWAEHQIGTESGDFFGSENQAANDAKINGLITRKPVDAAVKLESEINDLTEQLKVPPAMDADVHELNRYQALEDRLNAAKAERRDLDFTGLDGYEIKNQGFGIYLSKMTPINIHSYTLADNLSKTAYDKVFQPGWVKTLIGWARTPEETLAMAENDQRKIATHAPAYLLQGFQKASKELDILPAKYAEEFGKTLDAARYMTDANGKIGYFMRSPGELEDFYMRSYGRFPSEEETSAYFAFTRNVELERALRDVSVLRNKASLGAEQRRLTLKDAKGVEVKSPFFDAMTQKDFPAGNDTVLVQMAGKRQRLFIANQLIPNKVNNELRDMVTKGEATVLRLYNPEERKLNGFGRIKNEKVRFIITDGNFESKPLAYGQQVNRRGGGHFDFKAESYARQAKIVPETIGDKTRYHYEGDNTLFALPPIKAAADKLIEHLNAVREHMKAGREAEAEAYNNANLHMPWDKHLEKYKKGLIDPNEPIHNVPAGRSVMDLGKEALENRYTELNPVTGKRRSTLIDGTRSGSDARQFQVQYTGERDVDSLMGFSDVGTAGNPVFQYEPAAMVDPLVTYNRALKRIINSFWMDDMKMNSMLHWLEQAKPYLDATEAEIRNSPFQHFNYPLWKPSTPDTAVAKLNLELNRQKINRFNGTPSKIETFIQSANQSVVNGIYKTTGPRAAMLANDALAKTRDPIGFLRTATFHAKLGLFSLPQIFTQLMTHSNVFAIAGLRPAAGGTMAGLLHRWATFNGSEEILDALDKKASSFSLLDSYGFKPGQWKEAYDLLERSGFRHVGGENAMLDSPFYTNIIQNGGRTFLDWGETFFREGAEAVRRSAFYTSYLEHRAENPIGALTRADEEKILARAALLDHNMSRASNSALHTGILAPAGQFMAYSLRLMELFTGKRLTGLEKTRLFANSAILYGVPLGGIGLLGAPVADMLRQYANDQGWLVHDNFFKDVVMEGLPATVLAMMTSKDWDPAKGNWYNVSKWGPESYQLFENALNTDSTIWKMVGGAAIGTTYNTLMSVRPIWYWGSSFLRPDNQQFPLTADDFIEPFRNISSVNNEERLRAAIHFGKWLSTHGTYLDDVSPYSAIFMSVTGLQPTSVADITISHRAIQSQKADQVAAESLFSQEIQRELVAASNNDTEQADKFHKQAMAILEMYGYPLEKRAALLARSLQDNQSLVQRLREDYWLHNVPPAERESRLKIYSKMNEIQGQK
jgi:hypothetical protein